MSEYTPTTEQVEDVFLLGAIDAAGGEENPNLAESLAMFHRWLREHDAKVWDEGEQAGWSNRDDTDAYLIPEILNPYRGEPNE